MTRKTILIITLVLGLVVVGTYAYAGWWGHMSRSGYGHMMEPGYQGGYGHMMEPGYHRGFYGNVDPETIKLGDKLNKKWFELRAILSKEPVDEEKVKRLSKEINELENELHARGPRTGYFNRGDCWR